MAFNRKNPVFIFSVENFQINTVTEMIFLLLPF